MADLAEQLIEEEEGRVPYAYRDSEGYMTIGVGCLVDERVPGAGLCHAAIDAQLAHDMAQAREDAANLPGFQRLNPVQQAVLISMCFQLGNLHDWPHFKGALAMGDLRAAAGAGLNSQWAKQTPARAQRQMRMLETGEWVEKS